MDRMAVENLRSSKLNGIQKSHSTTQFPWNNEEALHFAKTRCMVFKLRFLNSLG